MPKPAPNRSARATPPIRRQPANAASSIDQRPAELPPAQTRSAPVTPTSAGLPGLADRASVVGATAEALPLSQPDASFLAAPQMPIPTAAPTEGITPYRPSEMADPMSFQPPVRRKFQLASLRPPRGPATERPMRSYLEPGEPLPDWAFPPGVLAARKAEETARASAAAQSETDPDSDMNGSLKDNTHR
jgi:hypothetical protein